MEKETKRKIIHITMGFLTILLGFFPRLLAILAVLIALFFVLVIARPNVWQKGFESMASREEDQKSGFLHGPALYVFMVLLLVIFFDLRIAAAVFAIMAFGDGLANVIGTKFGRHRFEAFQNKSIEGTAAFICFAFLTSTLAFFWASINPDFSPWLSVLMIQNPEILDSAYIIICCFVVSVIAAFIEFLTGHIINDNISVPISASFILTILFKF
jgi:dolichol kinase